MSLPTYSEYCNDDVTFSCTTVPKRVVCGVTNPIGKVICKTPKHFFLCFVFPILCFLNTVYNKSIFLEYLILVTDAYTAVQKR